MQTHGCMVCRLTERQLNGQTDPLTDGQTEECRQSHPQMDRGMEIRKFMDKF